MQYLSSLNLFLFFWHFLLSFIQLDNLNNKNLFLFLSLLSFNQLDIL